MTASGDKLFGSGPSIDRRRFLQWTAGGAAWLTVGVKPAFAGAYRVGVAKGSTPYAATTRAVEASREWPSDRIAGKRVVIKPNLVMPETADSGVTTDPDVVRALVDMALDDGAAEVLIVEGGVGGPNFSACGYDFFAGYDPRVRLVDLNEEEHTFAEVPGGMTYQKLYLPSVLLDDDTVLISAAKLKTHSHTHATLSMKNLIGLAPVENYRYPPEEWRFGLHDRGISQAIVDLNLLRPIDFAVVDGYWAMEGDGPVSGTPVYLKKVVAGRNPVAVDRVCLEIAKIPQLGVMHLTYASRKGLGPSQMSEITVQGSIFPYSLFEWPPDLPPIMEYPRVYPYRFVPSAGQQVAIYYSSAFPCYTRIEVVGASDVTPELVPVRTLRDWQAVPAGLGMVTWDGRNDGGAVVPAGWYLVRVLGRYYEGGTAIVSTGWVRVI